MKSETLPLPNGRRSAGLALVLGLAVAVSSARSQESSDAAPEGPALPASTRVTDGQAAQGGCNYYDGDSTIDVLAIYTNRARLQNSSNDIDAYIQAQIDTMNQVLRNSLAHPRVRLVHSEEVSYDEGVCTCNFPPSGIDNDTTIDRLLNPNDGFLDAIPALRDTYHADIVLMITSCTNCGGVAACNHGDQYILDASGGYAVVSSDWPIAFPWGTAHELGHVLGCGHSRDAENCGPGCPRNCSAFPYSYGYSYIGDDGQWNHTVLSYGPALCGGSPSGSRCKLYNNNTDCPPGQTCALLVPPTKIPYYSNPAVSFDGEPTGVPAGDPDAADCALTIDTTAFTVANYRQRPGNIWVDFANSGSEFGCFEYPYNTLAEGLAHVPDQGTLIFKSGSTTATTGQVGQRVTLEAYGGTVRIGG